MHATLIRKTLIITFAISTTLFSAHWSEHRGIQVSFHSAYARIGRPATPISGAGVARRSTRRAVAVGAAVTTLPRGCVTVYANNRTYYRCGGTYYRRSGNTYTVVTAP